MIATAAAVQAQSAVRDMQTSPGRFNDCTVAIKARNGEKRQITPQRGEDGKIGVIVKMDMTRETAGIGPAAR
jgi:hypothetical protein